MLAFLQYVGQRDLGDRLTVTYSLSNNIPKSVFHFMVRSFIPMSFIEALTSSISSTPKIKSDYTASGLLQLTLLKSLSSTEHSGVVLHGLLHLEADIGSRFGTIGETNLVEIGNTLLTSVLS